MNITNENDEEEEMASKQTPETNSIQHLLWFLTWNIYKHCCRRNSHVRFMQMM